MSPKLRMKGNPEEKVRAAIIDYLRLRGWYVKIIHSSTYMPGMPDLFASHVRYGMRWIEVKEPNRKGNLFTPAQLENFPLMSANGAKIWLLVGATDDEYVKLFRDENWYLFRQELK